MTKFKAYITINDNDSKQECIGTYSSKEEACGSAYSYARNKGYTSGCDVRDSVIEALMSRDYYMLAYGPREIEIVEGNF